VAARHVFVDYTPCESNGRVKHVCPGHFVRRVARNLGPALHSVGVWAALPDNRKTLLPAPILDLDIGDIRSRGRYVDAPLLAWTFSGGFNVAMTTDTGIGSCL